MSPRIRLFDSSTFLHLAVACALGLTLARFVSASSDQVPNELSSTDWASIRAAYEAKRHAVVAYDGGYLARNPSQHWRTQFDGRGFVTRPDAGGWSWGLELVKYGREGGDRAVKDHSCVNGQGNRVEYEWNDCLTEWYINDAGGLEHGYILQTRPGGAGSLQFFLAVRGNLRPHVSKNSHDVSFMSATGETVVNYSNLKVIDANGAEFSGWFELAGDGLRLTVDDRGARYPLIIDPTATAQQAYLKASNTNISDQFGGAVAVSGDTVVVGAIGESSSATGVNGNQADDSATNAGAAYVFVRSGTTWTQQAYLKASNTDAGDNFGWSVGASGDTVVIGAFQEDSNATGVNGNQFDNSSPRSGAAYVFVRNGGAWSQQAYLKASNTEANDSFARSLAISGETIIVGANLEDSNATGVNGNGSDNSAANSGAAYVFVRNGSTWTQQAYLKASNTDANDNFGISVSISGDTAVVGARLEASNATGANGNQADNSAAGAGAAYVFVRNGTIWSQQAYLKASNTGAGDQFGGAVAISGDTVVVGARQEASNATGINGNQNDNSAAGAGAAYVFVRSGANWSQQAYLKASNTDAADFFGQSVAVSGDTVAVSADSEDSNATGVDGNGADNVATSAGAAYVFDRWNTIWRQVAYIKASNTDANDQFGLSVAVSGGTLVVGAFHEASSAVGINGNQADNSAPFSGAAYVFILDADGDGVADDVDVCPNNEPGLPVDCIGRPRRDCNGDCAFNGLDIQCIVDELFTH